MNRVLITGARAPIALDLARSFAAAGWTPHLADSIRPWAARLARVAPLHRFAPPRFAFDAFTADLEALVQRIDPAIIVPTCEEVFYVAAAGERMGFAERVFAPPLALLRTLHSKVEFARLARAAGIPAPDTHRVSTKGELACWRTRSNEFVFKPEFSRFASHALVRPDPVQLARLAPTPDAPWAVQAFVEGEELCLWSAARAGEVIAFAAYRPLWRVGRSSSFYFAADRDPALLRLARAIAAATGATGQLSFDVVRSADGAVVPIECNPRGVSGLHLFDADPALALAIAGEGPLATPTADARHLGLAMALLGAPQAIGGGRWREFRRDLALSGDVLAGSGAQLGALLDAARFTMVGLSRGRSASGQSTDDIEWNGEAIR